MITYKELKEKVIRHRDVSPVLKPDVHKPFLPNNLNNTGDRPDYGYGYGKDITSKSQKPQHAKKTNQNSKGTVTFGVDANQDGKIDENL